MIEGAGWIKLHRSMAEHQLWLSRPFTIGQAWVDLLMQANYHESTVLHGYRPLTIQRGQVFTSLERLRTRWQRDRKTVRAWLLAFESDGMLTRASAYGADGGYTLLTIRNYDRYQSQSTDTLDGDPDGGADGDLDRGADRALDRALDRGLPQSKKYEEVQESEEGKKGARPRNFSPNGGRTLATTQRHPDRDWGRT
jgi:hypothetical protein